MASNQATTATETAVQSSVSPLRISDAESKFNALLNTLNTGQLHNLYQLALESRGTVVAYLENRISRNAAKAQLVDKNAGEGAETLLHIVDSGKQDGRYDISDVSEPATSSIQTVAYNDDVQSPANATKEEVLDSVSTSGASSPAADEKASSERGRQEGTSLGAYLLSELISTAVHLPGVYQHPGASPNTASWVFAQQINSNLRDINWQASQEDANLMVKQLAKALGRIIDPGLANRFAQSLAFMPQALAVINTPEIRDRIEATVPGAGAVLDIVDRIFTGGGGSEAELNSAINTGKYTAGAAELVLGQVTEIGKNAQHNQDMTFRQVGSTVKFLRETGGYAFESAAGITEAQTRSEIVADKLSKLSREEYDALYNEFASNYSAANPRANTETIESAFVSALKNNDPTKFKEGSEGFRSFQTQVEEQFTSQGSQIRERQRLENLTRERRRLGQSALAIMSSETRQEIYKVAKDENMAEMLAADKMLSMYGGTALERGDYFGAIDQVQALIHTAQRAGLTDKDLEQQGKAIGTALGPEGVSMMSSALTASAMIQKDLTDRGLYLSQEMRAEIDQQAINAIQNQTAGELAWFMNLDLPESKLKGLQTRLKTGKMTKDDWEELRKWRKNRSTFIKDVAEATRMTTGQVAARLDDNTRNTALSQQNEYDRNTAITTARTVELGIENAYKYTEGAMKNRAGAYSREFRSIGGSDVVGSAVSILGSAGLDWASVLQGTADDETMKEAKSLLTKQKFRPLLTSINEKQTQFNEEYVAALRTNGGDTDQAYRTAFEALNTTENQAIQQFAAQVNGETYNPSHAVLSNTNITQEATSKQIQKSVAGQKKGTLTLEKPPLRAFADNGIAGLIFSLLGLHPTNESYEATAQYANELQDNPVMKMFNNIIHPIEKGIGNIFGGLVDISSGLFNNILGAAPPEPTNEPSTGTDVSYSGSKTQNVNIVSIGGKQIGDLALSNWVNGGALGVS